jgi:hypothetical protein
MAPFWVPCWYAAHVQVLLPLGVINDFRGACRPPPYTLLVSVKHHKHQSFAGVRYSVTWTFCLLIPDPILNYLSSLVKQF